MANISGTTTTNSEFDVNMASIDLALYLKNKGIPDEVCDTLESKFSKVGLVPSIPSVCMFGPVCRFHCVFGCVIDLHHCCN